MQNACLGLRTFNSSVIPYCFLFANSVFTGIYLVIGLASYKNSICMWKIMPCQSMKT